MIDINKLKNLKREFYEDLFLKELIGKTILKIVQIELYQLLIYTIDGKIFTLQNWNTMETKDYSLESRIEEIHGTMQDLIGTPITSVEYSVSKWKGEKTLFTFFEFKTIKGKVFIRWSGRAKEGDYGYALVTTAITEDKKYYEQYHLEKKVSTITWE